MRTTLTVPAGMVPHLRGGLHSEIGNAAQAILHVVETPGREEHPERYRAPLGHLDAVRALLDLIGWRASGPCVEIQVDLRRHGWALLAALRTRLLVENDALAEADAVDAERTLRGEAPRRLATSRSILALREFLSAAEEQVAALGVGVEDDAE